MERILCCDRASEKWAAHADAHRNSHGYTHAHTGCACTFRRFRTCRCRGELRIACSRRQRYADCGIGECTRERQRVVPVAGVGLVNQPLDEHGQRVFIRKQERQQERARHEEVQGGCIAHIRADGGIVAAACDLGRVGRLSPIW